MSAHTHTYTLNPIISISGTIHIFDHKVSSKLQRNSTNPLSTTIHNPPFNSLMVTSSTLEQLYFHFQSNTLFHQPFLPSKAYKNHSKVRNNFKTTLISLRLMLPTSQKFLNQFHYCTNTNYLSLPSLYFYHHLTVSIVSYIFKIKPLQTALFNHKDT